MSEESVVRLVFAADLGGTHLRAALVDETGRIHSHVKRATPRGDKPDFIIDALVESAEGLEATLPYNVVAASIVVPGTVDRHNTFVVQAPNLPSLDNFGLKATLQDRLKLPVLLENDANAAAVGEMWLGAARGARNIICITLGTGVGGGIILDGKLWRGTDGSAGELGHTTVDPFRGPECKCGSTGCLEMFASATAIVRMTRESLSSFPKTILHDQCLNAAKVYDAAKAGDELALEIFKRVGEYLGVGLANLINILGPEVIVIGGGVANAWDLFEGPMRAQINRRAFPSAARSVQIKVAQCGDNAGLLGAARLAFDGFK
jgi:glucokinase